VVDVFLPLLHDTGSMGLSGSEIDAHGGDDEMMMMG